MRSRCYVDVLKFVRISVGPLGFCIYMMDFITTSFEHYKMMGTRKRDVRIKK
jgi:hypothetical protein